MRANNLCKNSCVANGYGNTTLTLSLGDATLAVRGNLESATSTAMCACDEVPPDTPTWPIYSGFQLKGDSCYEFMSTIPKVHNFTRDIVFHMYWRSMGRDLGVVQRAAIRAVFATQDRERSRVILWTTGRPFNASSVKDITDQFGDRFTVRAYNMTEAAKGTPVQKLVEDGTIARLIAPDTKAYLDGDLARLLLLWQHGGVWVDMDLVLMRSLSPLLHEEWILEWDCYMPTIYPVNFAIGHFYKNSVRLHELLRWIVKLMDEGTLPRPNSLDWGGLLYWHMLRESIALQQYPILGVLPWCFFDSSICLGPYVYFHKTPADSSQPVVPQADIFLGAEKDNEFTKDQRNALQGFGMHLHHAWDLRIQPGSPFDILLASHNDILDSANHHNKAI